ncbi:MAG: amt1 [Chthoniobacteraceae bacterium]|nr:amt1 [Chthoniobacteraceae bacterium]
MKPLILLLFGFTAFTTASAQQPAAAPVIDHADNAWMLISSALVLMMTGPGLALFYGGLVRTKNVLSTMMQSMFLMSLMSILWFVFGYSLAFGDGNAVFGSFTQHLFLRGVGAAPNPDYAATVPAQTFMIFQMMFAVITPALITGAFAERIKFSAFLLLVLGWLPLVYCPLTHMMWGKGGYFNWALGGHLPVLDFAGGTVVHISSGVSALVCAIVLGKRRGFPHEPMLPHNVVLSLIGTGLLWIGWFGFNAGSALNSGCLASSTFAATHFAGAAGGLSWAFFEWAVKGKPSVLGAASGMVAGLATITPASGFVTVAGAVCIGLAAGVVCYLSVTKLKARFGYDDSLDVFGVHCMGSIVGMLMVGFLASAEVNPAIGSTFQIDGHVVSLAGGFPQFFRQLEGVLFTAVLAGSVTYLLLKLIEATIGIRVESEDEHAGLDISTHGESAYNH